MTPDTFFACFPAVEAVCRRLRAVVREELPDAEEVVFEGWKNVS